MKWGSLLQHLSSESLWESASRHKQHVFLISLLSAKSGIKQTKTSVAGIFYQNVFRYIIMVRKLFSSQKTYNVRNFCDTNQLMRAKLLSRFVSLRPKVHVAKIKCRRGQKFVKTNTIWHIFLLRNKIIKFVKNKHQDTFSCSEIK